MTVDNKSNRLILFLVGMLSFMIVTLVYLPSPYNFTLSIAICGPISVCVMCLHYRCQITKQKESRDNV